MTRSGVWPVLMALGAVLLVLALVTGSWVTFLIVAVALVVAGAIWWFDRA